MKNFIKFACLILAMAFVLSTCACTCSFTKPYSYKTSDVELPLGVYIYNMYAAYNQAQTYAQKLDVYDSEKGTYDGKKSFLNLEITDDEEKTATADQWIADMADLNMRKVLAIHNQFNELKSTIDEATIKDGQDQCKEYWDHGPYYAYYGDQYDNPYSKMFEPIGVSYESFYQATFYPDSMKSQVFTDIYGKDGKEEVTDKELTKFFKENYTAYKYFSANLYKEVKDEDSTAEEGGTKNVSLSKDEIQEYKDKFDSYVGQVNYGDTYENAVKQYQADYDIENDPTTANVEILKDSSISEDMSKALKKLNEGEATYFITGEGDNQVIYFLYKEPIAEEVKTYIKGDTNRDTVLHKYKDDTFEDYLEEVGNNLEITKSSQCNSYSPKKMESLVNSQK